MWMASHSKPLVYALYWKPYSTRTGDGMKGETEPLILSCAHLKGQNQRGQTQTYPSGTSAPRPRPCSQAPPSVQRVHWAYLRQAGPKGIRVPGSGSEHLVKLNKWLSLGFPMHTLGTTRAIA